MLALSTAKWPRQPQNPGRASTFWMLLLLVASLAVPYARPIERLAPQQPSPRGFPPLLDLAPTPRARPYELPDSLAGRPELVGRRR